MQRNIIIKKTIILNLFILLVIVNFGYNLVEAKEIYVPADYRTIQEAVDAAISGDTVMVAPGTYEETIELKNGLKQLKILDLRVNIEIGMGF